MCAVNSDREKFAAAADQQDLLSTGMAEYLGTVRELVLRKAKGKIRTTGFGMIQLFFPFKGRGRIGGRRFGRPPN
jgi:hypothetical protein